MKILLGNSIGLASEDNMILHHAVPIEFADGQPINFLVPPPPLPMEPVGLTATGSLLSARSREEVFQGSVPTVEVVESDKEPAGFVTVGSPLARSAGEFNEPLASEWDDFMAPSDAHALSDWPL